MSKLLSSLAIAIVAGASCLSLQAQVNLPVRSIPASAPVTPGSIDPANLETTPNLDLLAKGFRSFYQYQRVKTKSNTILKFPLANGKTLQFTIDNETIAETDRKFRSEISVSSSQSKPINYTIISNGKTVWIYRPDLKKYSQMNIDRFDEGQLSIGMSSWIFCLASEKERMQFTDPAQLRSFLTKAVSDPQSQSISEEKIQVNNRKLHAFNLKFNLPNRYTYRGVIDSNGNLSQIEFIFKYEGIYFTGIQEKIIERMAIPPERKVDFTFASPQGVKKVKSLKVIPIGDFR